MTLQLVTAEGHESVPAIDFSRVLTGEPMFLPFLEYNDSEHKKYVANKSNRDLARTLWKMECLVLKCMDGRLDLTRWTKLLYGLVQSLRTPGGVFEAGHPLLRRRVLDLLEYASKVKGRHLLVVVAYHFSRSGSHLGCRFEKGDRAKVREFGRALSEAMSEIYGRNQAIYIVCFGMETDQEALIFEGVGSDTRSFSVADEDLFAQAYALNRLGDLYPGMASQVLGNLAGMAFRNSKHVVEVCRSRRSEEHLAHNEHGMLLGEGADFHHLHNDLLIISPVLSDLETPVRTALDINRRNFHKRWANLAQGGEARTSVQGILLIGSAYYRDDGPDRRSADAQARQHLEYQLKVLHASFPELVPAVTGICGAVDFRTRKFHLLEARTFS